MFPSRMSSFAPFHGAKKMNKVCNLTVDKLIDDSTVQELFDS